MERRGAIGIESELLFTLNARAKVKPPKVGLKRSRRFFIRAKHKREILLQALWRARHDALVLAGIAGWATRARYTAQDLKRRIR